MKELTVAAELDRLDEVLAFVDASLEEMDCPMKTQMQINIAVEELFVNIAHYAYTPGVGDATIRTEPQESPRALAVTFIDSGMPFDPLAKTDPDVTLSAEERKVGGLGIYMVKKSMDAMEYEHKDGQNVLTIRKEF